MKKITVYSSPANIAAKVQALNEASAKFQLVINELKKLNLPVKAETGSDLKQIVSDPENWAKQKIAEGMKDVPTIFGIKVKKSKAVDLLELPNFAGVKEAAKECEIYATETSHKFILEVDSLEIINDKVQPTRKAINEINEANTLQTATPIENEALEAHKQLAECINTMKKVFAIYGTTKLEDLLLFTDNQNKAEPRFHYWQKNTIRLNEHRRENTKV